MNMLKTSKKSGAMLGVLAALAICLVAIFPALAAPPGNDDIFSATTIFGLPFYENIDTSEATVAGGDPFPSCNYYGILEATIWYQFTPITDTLVTASTSGSEYTTNLAVYTGSPSELNEAACAIDNSPVGFQAAIGQTYYIMIAAVDDGAYPSPGGYGGWLNFSLDTLGPPQAYFDYWSDPGYGMYAYYFNNWSYDPAGHGMTAFWDFGDGGTSTDWSTVHQFPAEGSYLVSLTVTTYDGRSATTQQEVFVTPPPPPVAEFDYWNDPYSGQYAYYFNNWSYDPAGQGMTAFWDFGDGVTSTEWSTTHQFPGEGSYLVTLTVTTYDGRSASTQRQVEAVILPPVADFYPYPDDPSTFDTVNFNNWSYDPSCPWCGMSAVWDFGDGTTSTEWSPSHQYAADGDYTVSLTVTTSDGRSASTSRNLQVRTHDVAITKFTVPQSAKAGQTRSVTVEVNNTRYPEQVEVQLYKSTVWGWEWVGSLRQSVPVRPSNRTTSFKFSYTFTADDAALGRINFRAVANLVDARDALPTNNEAISLPTKVNP